MDFDLWLIDTQPIASAPRAALAMNAIYDKPTSVVFRTDAGVTLPAQTLRLEYEDTVGEVETDAGMAAPRKLIIFGIHGHSSLPNSDIAQGYRFTYQLQRYIVTSVLITIGEIQANAEVY